MMKRLLLIILLFLISGPAYAEWVEVGANDVYTRYVDRDTIRRKGDLVKMWVLDDYKTAKDEPGDSVLSGKVQVEYNCTKERARRLAWMNFSGNMGSGKVLCSDSDEQEWGPVSPGSLILDQAIWKLACAKK
jgi:hypothetical protein